MIIHAAVAKTTPPPTHPTLNIPPPNSIALARVGRNLNIIPNRESIRRSSFYNGTHLMMKQFP
jgi:hypothetical protein